MAKRHRASVREALEAATGGSGAPADSRERTVRDESAIADAAVLRSVSQIDTAASEEGGGETAPPAAPEREVDARDGQARTRKRARRGRPKKDEGHRKTSTGYLTSSGQKIVRLTLHLTPEQKRKLKIKSLEAGFENASAYVVEALEL